MMLSLFRFRGMYSKGPDKNLVYKHSIQKLIYLTLIFNDVAEVLKLDDAHSLCDMKTALDCLFTAYLWQ